MKSFVHLICLLILTCIVVSRRQKSYKSRTVGPRGHRHHIFKNANPSKSRKTTQVTKIVTVSGDGKETVKKFNHHNNKLVNNWDFNQQNHHSKNHGQNHKIVKKFYNHGQAISDYDYPANQNWNQEIDNHNHPPNPYPNLANPNFNPHPPNPSPDPDPHNNYTPNSNFANPYPDGSFGPHPPNPPHDTHQQIFDVPYPPWLVPKFKEYTTKCCTTVNVSSSDQSNAVTRGT